MAAGRRHNGLVNGRYHLTYGREGQVSYWNSFVLFSLKTIVYWWWNDALPAAAPNSGNEVAARFPAARTIDLHACSWNRDPGSPFYVSIVAWWVDPAANEWNKPINTTQCQCGTRRSTRPKWSDNSRVVPYVVTGDPERLVSAKQDRWSDKHSSLACMAELARDRSCDRQIPNPSRSVQ
jgi:hypothetical protein